MSDLQQNPCLLKDTMQSLSFYNKKFLQAHAMEINEGMPKFIIDSLEKI